MALNDKGYREKRDFFRMMVEAEVQYTVEGSSEKYIGQTEDLSATGIMFNTDHNLKVGQKIVIEVLPNTNQLNALKATVDIIRVDVNDKGRFVVAGNMSEVQ
ncbi:MAG: PilZ domain-containing protein [Gammaproteobacteria bacterium]|nr:MAG: PilZ domain-containing protein [Gammaproteobacteria bacterium]